MKKLILACILSLFVSTAYSWDLVWDANPVSEGVVEYIVFEDGIEVGAVVAPATTYPLGVTLPEACWQVAARNGYGLTSDLSNQVCVGRPSAPGNARLQQ